MIIKGLEIFNSREEYLVKPPTVYPLIYNIFYSSFEIAKGKLKSPGVFLEQINQVAGIMEQKTNCDLDFIIYDFLSYDESKIFIENSIEKTEKLEYYPIAECNANKTLMVGVSSFNEDKIFIENLDLFKDGSKYKQISNNIFEFVSKIHLIELETIGYGISSYNQLFKNWDEDFWRIKIDVTT